MPFNALALDIFNGHLTRRREFTASKQHSASLDPAQEEGEVVGVWFCAAHEPAQGKSRCNRKCEQTASENQWQG
jgi:hypothetical protein